MIDEKKQRYKIGILTMHCVPNYGAVLQAYATVAFLRGITAKYTDVKFDIEIVDYQPLEKKKRYSTKALLLDSATSIRALLRNIRGYSIKTMNASKKLHRNAYEVLNSSNCLSKEIRKNELPKLDNEYDALVVGSDQVWNPFGMKKDYSFLLNFYSNGAKYSFSSSFGVSDFPTEYREIYARELSRFRHVAVRENAGLKIYESLTERNDGVVLLDPTLMLSVDEYKELEDDSEIHLLPGYTLVYLAMHSENLVKYATEHTQKDKEVVVFGMPDIVCRLNTYGCRIIRSSTIGGFLSLFHNAGSIYTNSFHGIAFSIIYKKELWIEWNNVHSKSNSRLENIVNKFGLQNRLISKTSNSESIDYESINTVIEREREKAMDYATQMMHEIRGGYLGYKVYHPISAAWVYGLEEAA